MRRRKNTLGIQDQGLGMIKNRWSASIKAEAALAGKKVYPNWKKMDTFVDFFKAN